MRRLLQSIIYNRKLYDRPLDEWVCGRAAEGTPCVFGPGAKGECRATSQCLPAKKGDRWVCTRLISLGGACDQGPLPDGACGCPVRPCSPQRNLRSQRRRLTWLTVCAAVGILLLAVGGDRPAWIDPGPLTSAHATSAQHCASCHVEGAPLALTPSSVAARNLAHNRLCLECHDLGPQGMSPHGATGVQLARLARRTASNAGPAPLPLVAAQLFVPGSRPELACAACHQEHHGRDFNLKQMTDQQCQICHQKQFENFVAGHPEFAGYPYLRRTRLQFDHVAHWQKHFFEPRFAAAAPNSCATCHEPAGNGRNMLVRGYEQACAACHAAQIAGEGRAGDKGLEFFRLPGFDVAALEKAGAPVGEWPKFCEGSLTPFMRWMLDGDPAARAALAVLGRTNLADLSSATPDQKEAASRLLWSVKCLLADLVTQGQQFILHRLSPAGAMTVSSAARTGQLPADGLLAVQQAWLPNLLAEVAAFRHGAMPAAHHDGGAGKTVAASGDAGPGASAKPAPAGTAADDDLLSGGTPEPKSGPPASGENASGDDLLAPGPAPAAAPAASPTATVKLEDAEARVAAGGWYRRDETYTLYYRPAGHAEPFLTAWLDATAGDVSPEARAIFGQLSADTAPGVCMKCHSVDQTKTATIVNWRTNRPPSGQRLFTTFKHSAHFSLMGDQGCVTCHVFDGKAAYAASFGTNRDPAVFHSNFVPLSKNTCATCHRPSAAGAGCLECHNYHTGEMKMLQPGAAVFHRAPGKAGK